MKTPDSMNYDLIETEEVSEVPSAGLVKGDMVCIDSQMADRLLDDFMAVGSRVWLVRLPASCYQTIGDCERFGSHIKRRIKLRELPVRVTRRSFFFYLERVGD